MMSRARRKTVHAVHDALDQTRSHELTAREVHANQLICRIIVAESFIRGIRGLFDRPLRSTNPGASHDNHDCRQR